MKRTDVTYLSYITDAKNVPSILEHGILCHNLVQEIHHVSVADAEVQALRAAKSLPNGEALHDYANLYFWARNAMMYRLRELADICALRVDPAVLDIQGVHYSSRNAAVRGAEFHPFRGNFDHLDKATVYSGSWMTDDGRDEDKMEIMQAEVLVPGRVDRDYLDAVYVRSDEDRTRLGGYFGGLDCRVHGGLFFE